LGFAEAEEEDDDDEDEEEERSVSSSTIAVDVFVITDVISDSFEGTLTGGNVVEEGGRAEEGWNCV